VGNRASRSKKRETLKKASRYLLPIFKSNLFWTAAFVGAIAAFAYYNADKIAKTQTDYFRIKKIVFDGNEKTRDAILLKASGLTYRSNIFAYSVDGVKRKLENVPWIKSATVQRKLPDTIYIRVAERTPIAILQSKRKLYLVDADGKVLEDDGIGNFGSLPIIIGDGAEKEADKLFRCLERFPKIRKQLAFALRIGKRRWNIKINRGITVKLPETGIAHALGILEEISDRNGFFGEDISAIDLRMLDRVVVTKKEGKK
jgi:cell division protein FtsQ